MRSPDALTELFRGQGLKVTPQRQCIFRALDGNREHPSAEAVYEAVRAEMPTISLRTVYQTLNDLAAMGEISPLDVGTGSTRFDPNVVDHHHLVCDRCGTIVDVDAHHAPATARPPEADARGFTVSRAEIVYRGRCAACQAVSAG